MPSMVSVSYFSRETSLDTRDCGGKGFLVTLYVLHDMREGNGFE